jgi:hypothetical protein
MFRALENFHVQHVEKTFANVVNTMGEGSFTQGTQGNIAGFLLDGSALRFIGELLGCAGVAEPHSYIVNRMHVIQAAFAGLEDNSQHEQVVIFQDEMVVRLLLDWNGCRSFLRGEECKEDERGRDVEPGFHGWSLSWGLAAG